jgi:hypothetical protein
VSTTTLKHGTGIVAEKVAESAAERLPGRKAKPKHRGRKLFGAILAIGAAAFAATKGRKAMQQRREQQQVLDLTLGPQGSNGQTTATASRATTAP